MSESSSAAVREEHTLEAISFREYKPADLQRGVEMTADAWPELTRGGLDLATMEWYGWPATWKEVACVSDTAVGILFGKVYCDLGMFGRMRTPLAHATVYLKLLFGLYGKILHRLSFVKTGWWMTGTSRQIRPRLTGRSSTSSSIRPIAGRALGRS